MAGHPFANPVVRDALREHAARQTATARLTRYLRLDVGDAMRELRRGAGHALRDECERQGVTSAHLATITGTRPDRWEATFAGDCDLEWVALGFAVLGYDLGITARPRAGHEVRSVSAAAERMSAAAAARESRRVAGGAFRAAATRSRGGRRHSPPGGSSSSGGA